MNIAMWSGPRNLSTAMMYSFGSRNDFDVVDEPFYAAYLSMTGIDHPMRAEILKSQLTDPADVASQLVSNMAKNANFYQKHMTQHMLKDVPRDWMAKVKNVFLIRHPARVVASYSAKRENPTLDDIGFVQQAELYDHVVSLGQTPIVIDSADIRRDPEGMLRKLCDALGLDWDPAMLHWPPGPKPYDGVWAKHWYGSVHNSTGFAGAEGPLPTINGKEAALVNAALPSHEKLESEKLA